MLNSRTPAGTQHVFVSRVAKKSAMAKEITVRQLSGQEGSFAVSTHTTIREFKRQLHAWLPCEDESKRNMSSVKVVVGDRPLLNEEELVSEAIPGAEVLAFPSIQPVVCSSFHASGCEVEDLLVVEIPGDVIAIQKGAFEGCRLLASVTIPNSVTEIGQGAFSSCSSLASVTIPDSVTEIGLGTFSGCSSLASVTIPNSVTKIGLCAFSGCSSLASVTIPDSVTIGQGAFSGCSSLASVTIPDSTTEI